MLCTIISILVNLWFIASNPPECANPEDIITTKCQVTKVSGFVETNDAGMVAWNVTFLVNSSIITISYVGDKMTYEQCKESEMNFFTGVIKCYIIDHNPNTKLTPHNIILTHPKRCYDPTLYSMFFLTVVIALIMDKLIYSLFPPTGKIEHQD